MNKDAQGRWKVGMSNIKLKMRVKGYRKGYWAVTVKTNQRIMFRFEDGHAYDVELIDYH